MKYEKWYFPERKCELELKRSMIPENPVSIPINVDLDGESVINYDEIEMHPDGSCTVRRVAKKTPVSVYFIFMMAVVAIAFLFLNDQPIIIYNTKDGVSISSLEPDIHPVYHDVVLADGNVFIRSCPGTDGEKLGVLDDGTQGEYLGSCAVDDSGRVWYKIQYRSCVGWVSSKHAVLITHMIKE